MASLSIALALLPATIGVLAHLTYFIRGEHLVQGPSYLALAVALPTIVFGLLTFHQQLPWLYSARLVATIFSSFVTGLTSSIVVYRLLFHPLKKYPGPIGARISKLWHFGQNVGGVMNYELLDRLHKQYGDVVRTGPNQLSIIDSDVIEPVYGARAQAGKPDWYAIGTPLTTLHQMRDRTMHDRRRRSGWDKAFNTRALREYDVRIIGFADKLVQQLEAFGGKPVNATKWMHYYGYDVMGSLGFGRSFNTLESGESHFAIDVCQQGQEILRYATGVPWLVHLLFQIPMALNPIAALLKYSDDCVRQRRAVVQDGSDIISHLIESESFFGDRDLDHMLLMGDSRLVIIAGSDTTSAALAYSCFYLARSPEVVKNLRAELAENGIKTQADISIPELQNLNYLNGVIQETLRLHPPVPAGVFRQTPPEGLQIGKSFVPGGVHILTPHYSMHRSPRHFQEPNSFIPERWSTKPELVLNKDAYMPFSTGPYGCIGKVLAANEMRTVISKLVLAFEISLAPGESGHKLINEAVDMFTVIPGELNLCFNRRT